LVLALPTFDLPIGVIMEFNVVEALAMLLLVVQEDKILVFTVVPALVVLAILLTLVVLVLWKSLIVVLVVVVLLPMFLFHLPKLIKVPFFVRGPNLPKEK
jgi:hypothetical protein